MKMKEQSKLITCSISKGLFKATQKFFKWIERKVQALHLDLWWLNVRTSTKMLLHVDPPTYNKWLEWINSLHQTTLVKKKARKKKDSISRWKPMEKFYEDMAFEHLPFDFITNWDTSKFQLASQWNKLPGSPCTFFFLGLGLSFHDLFSYGTVWTTVGWCKPFL